MKFNFADWIGQVTTGHGAMILGPTLLAVASKQMSWMDATPLLVAGAVGLLWPENTGLKTASQNAVTDVETLVTAYRAGLNHGGAVVAAPAPVAVPAQLPVPVLVPAPDATVPLPTAAGAVSTAAAVMLLGLALFGLSACGSQQGQSAAQLGCKLDVGFQPIAAATLATLVPATSVAVSIDDLLVHPAVVAYCDGLGGTPAATPAVAPVAAVPAPAATPAAAVLN